ncbi:adiponectin receptor protein 2 isoform X1, partial [Tachysurus ichikawai]
VDGQYVITSPHLCTCPGCFMHVLTDFCFRAPQFHSHQLFHILVVAGAFVHFHGVSNLQEFRYTAGGGCTADGPL